MIAVEYREQDAETMARSFSSLTDVEVKVEASIDARSQNPMFRFVDIKTGQELFTLHSVTHAALYAAAKAWRAGHRAGRREAAVDLRKQIDDVLDNA